MGKLTEPPLVGLDEDTLKTRKPRHLPHCSCMGAVYHVVFRLADSVPVRLQEEWLNERKAIIKRTQKENRTLTEFEEKRLQYLFSDKIETYLDSGYGECWLKLPGIAKIVADAIRFFDEKRYRLYAWCVLPNHAHVIVEPLAGHKLTKIVGSWKSFSATEANKILKRTGKFWMHDSFDHIIRSIKAFHFYVNYVWVNPEKAGLTNVLRWRVGRASCSPPDEQ